MDRIPSPSHAISRRTASDGDFAHLTLAAGHFNAPHSTTPVRTKTSHDYVRALRRRLWLAVAVATVVASAGSVFVLRMPDVYAANAEIEINPPQYNPVLAAIFGSDMRQRETTPNATYVATILMSLRGKSVPVKVAEDPSLSATTGEIASELGQNLSYKQSPNTNIVLLTLEGKSPGARPSF